MAVELSVKDQKLLHYVETCRVEVRELEKKIELLNGLVVEAEKRAREESARVDEIREKRIAEEAVRLVHIEEKEAMVDRKNLEAETLRDGLERREKDMDARAKTIDELSKKSVAKEESLQNESIRLDEMAKALTLKEENVKTLEKNLVIKEIAVSQKDERLDLFAAKIKTRESELDAQREKLKEDCGEYNRNAKVFTEKMDEAECRLVDVKKQREELLRRSDILALRETELEIEKEGLREKEHSVLDKQRNIELAGEAIAVKLAEADVREKEVRLKELKNMDKKLSEQLKNDTESRTM